MSTIKLLEHEIRELKGLQAREREIQREYLEPLKNDFSSVLRSIEGRSNLPSDCIGKTYFLDTVNWALIERVPVDTSEK